MNTFIGIGHIAKAAQTRTVTVGGVPTLVTDFNVAINEGYGDTQRTEFIKCSIWRERGAKLAPSLTVGRSVTIKGAISCQAWLGTTGALAGKAQAQLTMANPAIEFNTGNPDKGDDSPIGDTEEA